MDLIRIINEKVKEKGIEWEVKALISPSKTLYSLGSDSKLIGRIFELIIAPILEEIAEEHNMILKASEKQTVYPDFTLMKNENDNQKIAIDIKTTYRRYDKKGNVKRFGFTLGSFASFMRNGTKNIMYPYSQYASHYVIGFVYDRNDFADEGKTFSLDDINSIPSPYKNVEFFVQEKYKIAGEKPGSGNTENIGSYLTNDISVLVNGKGPFSVLGRDIFDLYWINYPEYRTTQKSYTTIDDFFTWCEKNRIDIVHLRKLYEQWKKR